MKEYYNKFINGHLSLPLSFWLVGLFGTILVSFIILLILSSLNILSNPLLRIIAFPYLIIASIGIWKSSNNYKGLKIWSIGAKIIVVLWNLQNFLGVFIR